MCNVMTYYQGLFTPKGEKCFLIQAHENKLLHLSLMGKQELCLRCIFTHNFMNQKRLAIMYFMVSPPGSFYERVLITFVLHLTAYSEERTESRHGYWCYTSNKYQIDASYVEGVCILHSWVIRTSWRSHTVIPHEPKTSSVVRIWQPERVITWKPHSHF